MSRARLNRRRSVYSRLLSWLLISVILMGTCFVSAFASEFGKDLTAELPVPPAQEETVDLPDAEIPAQEETAEEPETDTPEQETPVAVPDIVMPEQSFQAEANGLTVTVHAPEGALPEGTTMEVSPVYDYATLEKIGAVVDALASHVIAVDITFRNAGGEPIEPAALIDVTIKASVIKIAEDPYLLHLKQDGDVEIVDQKDALEEDEIRFESKDFSVYAIVDDGNSGNLARMTVNFWNGTTKIATMFVKNSDTLEELETILYDPGVGTLASGTVFKGWAIDDAGYADQVGAEYDVEDADKAKNISEVRAWAEARSITEGDTVDLYAMIYNSYRVTFLNEDETAIGSDVVLVKTGEAEYEVSRDYLPQDDTHTFAGWNVKEGASNIQGHTDGTLYQHGQPITITGNVVFSVNLPEGHWLVFDENGKGATYNSPIFINSADVTRKPCEDSEMIRFGYTFGGWYADAACTTPFTFGNTINDRTVVYAKWNPNTYADYTVIIWKQNVSGNGYDFAESVTLNGRVGSTINTVTETGSGDGRYARVNGVNKRYTGFHLDRYDTNVTISTEGTSVLNVLYNRNNVTLTFYTWSTSGGYTYTPVSEGTSEQDGNYYTSTSANNTTHVYYNPNDRRWYTQRTWSPNWDIMHIFGSYQYSGNSYDTVYTRSGGQSRSWVISQIMTGLYGATLSDMGYTWPTNYWWYATGGNTGTASGTRTTFMDAFLPPDGSSSMNFYGGTSSGTRHIRFYKQNADNPAAYTLANDMTAAEGTFNISDKYNGFKAVAYSTSSENGPWTSLGDKNSSGYYASISSNTWRNGLWIRYDRLKYNLIYLDGVYVDGNNNPLDYANRGQLHVVEDIVFGSSMTSYNKGGSNYYEPTYEGFVFEGWYLDQNCTQPYTFTVMPEGLNVYAKWRQVEYRVFLDPNAGTDPTLDWGSESVELTFRVAENAKVSIPNPRRNGYELIGWYTKDGKLFNAQDTKLNGSLANLESYDKSTDFTDVMDKWGNGATWNSDVRDAQGNPRDRFWITEKLVLKAKWRKITEGARGIGIIYNANGGSNPPSDTALYLDQAEANAGPASTASSGKVFVNWTLQTWDQDSGQYVDTELKLYPGDSFQVLESHAKPVVSQWVNPQNEADILTISDPQPGLTPPDNVHTKILKANYTIQLKANYIEAENAEPTHIWWYQNYGDNSVVKSNTVISSYDNTGNPIYAEDVNVQINQPVIIKPADTFTRDGYVFVGWARVNTADGAVMDNLTKSDCFLLYNAETDQFTLQEAGHPKNGQVVTLIAADEKQPYHDLYAVWEVKKYDITITKLVSGNMGDKQKAFSIHVESDSDYAYTENDEEVLTKDHTFSLKHNESVTLTKVPHGAKITLSESGADGYTVSYTFLGEEENAKEKEISPSNYVISGNGTFFVKNFKEEIPDTGVQLPVLPFCSILILSLLLAGCLFFRRRLTEE